MYNKCVFNNNRDIDNFIYLTAPTTVRLACQPVSDCGVPAWSSIHTSFHLKQSRSWPEKDRYERNESASVEVNAIVKQMVKENKNILHYSKI